MPRQTLVEQAKKGAEEAWRTLCQQNMKHYTIAFTMKGRMVFYTAFAIGMMAASSISLAMSGTERRHVTNYSSCTQDVCTYNLVVEHDMQGPVFMYQHVKEFVQNHMLYLSNSSMEEGATDCTPYEGPEGALVYPCSFFASTYPDESYQLVSASGESIDFSFEGARWTPEHPDAGAVEKERSLLRNPARYDSWRHVSTFENSYKLMGTNTQGLPKGEYTLEISGNQKTDFLEKEVVLVSGLGRFGTVPASLEPIFFCVASLLVLVSAVGYYCRK